MLMPGFIAICRHYATRDSAMLRCFRAYADMLLSLRHTLTLTLLLAAAITLLSCHAR